MPAPVPHTVAELVHRAGNGHQLHTAPMDWHEELHPREDGGRQAVEVVTQCRTAITRLKESA
jgi:hypothetical protein